MSKIDCEMSLSEQVIPQRNNHLTFSAMDDNSQFSFDELSEKLLKKMVKVTKAEIDRHDGHLPVLAKQDPLCP